MGRLTGRAVAALAAAVLLLGLVVPVAAAAEPSFGRPTASAEYGVDVEFVQPVNLTSAVERAEILLEFPGSIGPHVIEADAPSRTGSVTLRYQLRLAEGHLLPNTTIAGRWRVTDADGAQAVGPSVTVRYEDTRFEWQTRDGTLVRVHWAEGSGAFGDRALQIGERAVEETSALLGVTESDPIDFFVYPDQTSFYDALGPGTRENVGGQSNAEIRTMFALITPGEIDDPWVDIVVPHELVHLVFDTAVRNPYHFPPRWLNEGLAVYLSAGNAVDDRLRVEQAARDGSLIPLDGLAAQFPTTFERFSLAYAESVSAVDFLIGEYGQDALVGLIRSYADGVSDDQAFEAALGVDVAAFDTAWRESLRAREPQVYGPQPAPAGPLPPGWLGEAASPAPTVEPDLPTPAGSGLVPGVDQPDSAGNSSLGLAIAILFLGGVAVATIMILRRRGARSRDSGPPVIPPPPEFPSL